MQSVPKRSEVPKELTWDLESVYANDSLWEQDFAQVESLIPKLAECQGALGRSAQDLKTCVDLYLKIYMLLDQMVSYARMRRDEDTSNPKYIALADRGLSLWIKASAASAFIVPEVLAIAPETVTAWVQSDPDLQIYAHYLEDLGRQRPHVRTAEIEELLAQTGEVARAPEEIFGQLNDADLKFPNITDAEGNSVELTQERYIRFIESADRRVRRDAYKSLYQVYRQHSHTLATTLGSQVKTHVFFSRARRHASALAASLHGNNIPVAVYKNLIATVRRNLHYMHRYVKLRKRILGLDEMYFYDLYVPIVPEVSVSYTYPEAVDTVLASLAPLGETYVHDLRQGVASRWVDVMENEGKRSGAYSGGAYTTAPFVLLNYQGTLNDVFTVAHELGHSMHFYYTRRSQPFVYGDTNIFVAEVASTLNEQLLSHHLLQQTADPKLRQYLVNYNLEQFRRTLYRQTMFAEFELWLHEQVEAGAALTVESLCEQYRQLNADYYGPDLTLDDDIALEWSRIPHFYYNFYVFQYATGMSAAVALSQQILSEGQPAVDRYLGFLRSGNSDYAINVLQRAGVDMASPDAVQQALDVFGQLLGEMEAVIGR